MQDTRQPVAELPPLDPDPNNWPPEMREFCAIMFDVMCAYYQRHGRLPVGLSREGDTK